MGMNPAALIAEAQMYSNTALKLRRKWAGKIRVLLVVKIILPCWIPKTVNSTPETTNRAMTWPLFQGYKAPPKFVAIKRLIIAPILKIVPKPSNSRSR